MEGLINALKYLAEHEPIDNFEEIRIRNSPIELAAVLLLLGMVAAIALVHRKTVNPKRMDPADQVKVRADQGRMRLVKMEAIKPQVESAEESEVSDGLKPEGEGKA